MIYFTGDLFLGNKKITIETNLHEKLDTTENIIVINLESVVLVTDNLDSRKDKSAILSTTQDVFLHFVSLFKKAKLIFNLGNNHLHDFGFEGIESTLCFLEKNNIFYFGLIRGKKDISSLIIDHQGKKIMLMASSTSRMEVMSITSEKEKCFVKDYSLLGREQILEQKGQVDKLIYLPHWGKEYIPYPSLEILDLANSWIEDGVDYIVGSHTHILQGSLDNNIYFSLGNFYFTNFKKKNRIWHLWKKINRLSLVVGIDFINTEKKNLVLGLKYKNSVLKESNTALQFYSKVTDVLKKNNGDRKAYFSFYENEYFKYLVGKNNRINRINNLIIQISIKIYEKIIKKSKK